MEKHFVAVIADLQNQPDSILHQVERGSGEDSREALERELAARLTERHGRQVDPEALPERMFAAAEVNDAMVEILGYARNAGWRTAVSQV